MYLMGYPCLIPESLAFRRREYVKKELQNEIAEGISDRPLKVTPDFFTDRVICADNSSEHKLTIDKDLALIIYDAMVQNGYVHKGILTEKWFADRKNNSVILDEEFEPYRSAILKLLDSVYSPNAIKPENAMENNVKLQLNKDKLHSDAFQQLWHEINSKSAYTVYFNSAELVKKSINTLNSHLYIDPVLFKIESGNLEQIASKNALIAGQSFIRQNSAVQNVKTAVSYGIKYDLIGKLVQETNLTRKDIADILCGLKADIFTQFKNNPESFILHASKLINEQKATVIVEHISYNKLQECYTENIFTEPYLKGKMNINVIQTKKHLYDYLLYDSVNEKNFAEELDAAKEVVVYVKLPRGFYINTPVGHYSPDWAIAFDENCVRHIYFVAETKGSMQSMQFRAIEQAKIECAKRHFAAVSTTKVRYIVINSFDELRRIIETSNT